MCVMIYIAADEPLPLVPWDEERPAFHVTDVPKRRRRVCKHFTKRYVYYAGSHERCGCGFQYGEWPGEEEAEAEGYAASRQSRADLAEYLRQALRLVSEVELYACWVGHEPQAPSRAGSITPDDLTTSRTSFREREFRRVRSA